METLFDVKTAGWADWVMPKAKQLIADGAVTILANYPEYINAHVVGWGSDNDPKGTPDEHEVEIQRRDPSNPLKVDMWSCDCMWGQKSWGRTRKWQKYNGRMCSHALATLWRSLSTPQDLSGMEPGYATPPGQKRPTEPGQMAPTWEQQQMGIPGLEETGPQVTGPSESEIAIPPNPFEQKEQPVRGPKFPQRQQLYLWDLTAQPGQETPAEFAPIPPEQRTQTLQMPGAFSSVQSKENVVAVELDNGEQWGIMSTEIQRFKLVYGEFSFEEAPNFAIEVQSLLDQGRTPVVQLLRPVELEPRGGKHPMPGANPIDVNSENTPIYRIMDLGYDPASGGRIRADESTVVGPGAPEKRAPELLGGQQVCPAGKRGIILSLMPSLNWAFISVPLLESPGLHPHSLEGYVSYRDLKLLPEAQDPYRAKY